MNTFAVEPNRRILVIDDNRAIHEGFRKVLCPGPGDDELGAVETALFGAAINPAERPCFEIDSAYQSAEGLALAEQSLQGARAYAVAFVDVRMPPGWDGIETAARLWQILPEIQVVICTAYSDFSWEQMAAKLGHSDRLIILKKPFEPVEILQLATTLTEKWRLQQQAKLRLEGLELVIQQRTQALQQSNQQLKEQIAQRQKAQADREATIRSLEDALAKVRTLSGLIPICAGCKKIRDDKGFWNQVESYLAAHSDARFSHGLCPECISRLYPDLVEQ